jgi:hypothetical protein
MKSSQVDEVSVTNFYRELRTHKWTVAQLFFKITPLHGHHGKPRLPLLWKHAYRCVAWQQISYNSVILLGADRIENTVSYCWVFFTEKLLSNALAIQVTISLSLCKHRQLIHPVYRGGTIYPQIKCSTGYLPCFGYLTTFSVHRVYTVG